MHYATTAVRVALVAFLATLAACSRSPEPEAESKSAEAASPESPRPAEPPALPPILDEIIEPHTGDLDEIRKRRQIRMLVAVDRTHFFVDRGAQKGVTADAIAEFDRWLNKELNTPKNLKIQTVVVPVRRDQLAPALLEGRGDVIATYVTDTPERRKLVAFAEAGFHVTEIVVTHAAQPPVASVDALAGREVWVRTGSAHQESLAALNTDFKQRGLAPVTIRELDSTLAPDEVLEMVNAGVIPLAAADRYIAKLWVPVLPDMRVHEDVQLRAGAPYTWAMRQTNPQLQAVVGKFQKTHGQGTLWGNMKLKEYFADGRFIRNPARAQDAERLRQTRALFEQYAAQYSFDWLLVLAQAYQESGLDHARKSHVGAIGIMQVMPTTARDPRVAIKDIQKLDRNIEAGVKYLRLMIDDYYKDEPMTGLDKALFALASYNAGPARVAKLRAEAHKKGLDPNVWFENVELIAARRIGAETVTYVRNIYKYYLAYRLMQEQGLIPPRPQLPSAKAA